MTILAQIEAVVVVAALLCGAGAVAARRQGWTVAAYGLGTLALVGEAWRHGADERLWVLGAVPLLLALGEGFRVTTDARPRGTRVSIDAAVYRQVGLGFALVVAVVVASAGAVLALPVATDGAEVALSPLLLPVGLFLLGLGVVGLAVGLGRVGRYRQVARRGAALVLTVMVVLVGAALVVGAAGLARVDSASDSAVHLLSTGPGSGQAEPGGFADDAPSKAHVVREPTRLSWWMSPLILVGLIVLIVVLGRREQLYPPDDLQPDRLVRGGPGPALDGATHIDVIDRNVTLANLEEALIGLRADTDPRVAVRLAYATVARGFGRQELGRRLAETEGEYLTRAFVALGAGGEALRRLTELFSVARFSDDPVDEAMREEALTALEQVRAQVSSARLDGSTQA